MSSANKIVMIGNLIANPEVRVTTEGTSMARFTLLIQRGGATQDKTDQIPVVCWGKLAEQAGESLVKGTMTVVEGRIQNKVSDDKDGQKTYTTEVIANYLRLLDGKPIKASSSKNKDAEAPVADDDTETYVEDDIPF